MPRADYPQITINVTQFEFKMFKKFKEDYGLSAREVLTLSGCPCDKCRGTDAIGFDKESGEPIKIPKGILCKRNI